MVGPEIGLFCYKTEKSNHIESNIKLFETCFLCYNIIKNLVLSSEILIVVRG